MQLIIAEKNSVGKSIAEVLLATTKRDGYYEGNGYLVSWCVGHLLAQAMPSVYDEKYTSWRVEDLPIIPSVWRYEPVDSTKKQLAVLKGLVGRSDVSTVVNACDAGREGELILRLVYEHCNCKKDLLRLWVSSMEAAAIREGFNNLRQGCAYDGLYQAALCRSRADWLVGINYSRLFSCLYNSKLSIGRVQTPTLAMIVEREQKIAAFVTEPLYTVLIVGSIEGGNFTAASGRMKDKAEAERIRAACDGKTAVIKSVVNSDKAQAPPRLYDLTSLQQDANKMLGLTAKQTLEIAQKLYEIKALTYPRTDSRFITSDMASGISALVASIPAILPFAVNCDADNINVAGIVNNEKVTDHHAIIPTPTAVSVDIVSLSLEEKSILSMVCTRLLAAVFPKHIYAETVVTVECEGETFTASGKTTKQDGWKAIERAFAAVGPSNGKKGGEEISRLPPLIEEQEYTAAASVREGFTQPPKHYTEDIRYKGGKRKPPKISWQWLIRSRLEAVCTKEDSGKQSICNLKTGNGITIAELLPFPYRNTPKRYKTIIA